MNNNIYFVGDYTVSCNGVDNKNDQLGEGHPNIFITIKKNLNEVQCPYCGKKFVYQEK